MCCNGSPVLCAGDVVYCDGGAVYCDGGAVYCDGGAVYCDGGAVYCDGGAVYCDGGAVYCDGGAVYCDGGAVYCDGGGMPVLHVLIRTLFDGCAQCGARDRGPGPFQLCCSDGPGRPRDFKGRSLIRMLGSWLYLNAVEKHAGACAAGRSSLRWQGPWLDHPTLRSRRGRRQVPSCAVGIRV